MPKKELKKEWAEKITEGKKEYTLNLKLFKSALKISDDDGNAVNVSKRDNEIKIQRWGNVEWHREKCFNPTFDNGGFWESYRDLERQFENFLESIILS